MPSKPKPPGIKRPAPPPRPPRKKNNIESILAAIMRGLPSGMNPYTGKTRPRRD